MLFEPNTRRRAPEISLQSLTAYQYSVSGVKQNRAQYEHAYHNTGVKITDPLIPPVYKRHTYI